MPNITVIFLGLAIILLGLGAMVTGKRVDRLEIRMEKCEGKVEVSSLHFSTAVRQPLYRTGF